IGAIGRNCASNARRSRLRPPPNLPPYCRRRWLRQRQSSFMNRLLLLPLLLFVALVVFLLVGLFRDPREVPSPLINKPAPAFQLPQLEDPKKSFSAQEMRGKVWLLNVYASWCVSCRDEHPVLLK